MQPDQLARRVGSVQRLFLLMLLALVCHPQTASAATKIIIDANKGGEVHLKAGDQLELRLKSNPSTGYMWRLQPHSTALLKLVHQETAAIVEQPTEVRERAVGQPVFQIFRFVARRKGHGVLLLQYVRSWEKPMADEEQFTIHVYSR